MRFSFASLLALLAFATLAVAWTKEDHEIFRLRDEILLHEGDNVTFYSFVGVAPSASKSDIEKVLRKRSKQLHPDKAIRDILARRATEKANTKTENTRPGVTVRKGPSAKEKARVTREVNERYSRFTNVARVLSGADRQRYDHFLANGFPAWRGSGYYYARFRPGLGSVLVGLLIAFGGGAHYFALYVSWKRHKEFVQRYVSHARKTAWGNESGMPGIPGVDSTATAPVAIPAEEQQEQEVALNRRQKRMQDKDSKKKNKLPSAKTARAQGISSPVAAEPIEGPQGSKKRIQAENGKVLIVDSIGNVFLEETTEEGATHQFLLDPEEIARPTVFDTALFRLPVWAYSRTVGRILNKGPVDEDLLNGGEELLMQNQEDHSGELLDSATAMNAKAETRRRKQKSQGR